MAAWVDNLGHTTYHLSVASKNWETVDYSAKRWTMDEMECEFGEHLVPWHCASSHVCCFSSNLLVAYALLIAAQGPYLMSHKACVGNFQKRACCSCLHFQFLYNNSLSNRYIKCFCSNSMNLEVFLMLLVWQLWVGRIAMCVVYRTFIVIILEEWRWSDALLVWSYIVLLAWSYSVDSVEL